MPEINAFHEVARDLVDRIVTAHDEAEKVNAIPMGMQKVDMAIGKPSLTRYRLLMYDMNTDSSHIELEPVTGRTHQLRVHLAAIGHPILGDRLYRGVASGSAERMLLHASMLSFTHPLSGELLTLTSEPPWLVV